MRQTATLPFSLAGKCNSNACAAAKHCSLSDRSPFEVPIQQLRFKVSEESTRHAHTKAQLSSGGEQATGGGVSMSFGRRYNHLVPHMTNTNGQKRRAAAHSLGWPACSQTKQSQISPSHPLNNLASSWIGTKPVGERLADHLYLLPYTGEDWWLSS